MPKTLKSLAVEAQVRMDYWQDVLHDSTALKDLNKTRQEALVLANYYEGRMDAFYEAQQFCK